MDPPPACIFPQSLPSLRLPLHPYPTPLPKKMELLGRAQTPPKEQAQGRLQRDCEGCVPRGMVLKLHLQKNLLFKEAVLGVSLMRSTLMKVRGS